jgi:S1-C subfamily serine protease
VLTNSHVVHRAPHLKTITCDGAELTARLVGDDPATDLAVVRIDGVTDGPLPYLALEPAASVRPGQLAVAIGNPLGFASTVSAGVVSGIGRSLRGRDGRLIDDVIQHTAPINPGSSGGPLVSSAAELLGINTAMMMGSQAIGFAIPVWTAAWVVSQLLTRGRVRRGWLGVAVQPRRLDRRLARAHAIPEDRRTAVEVNEVVKGSPSDGALREGDLIVSFASKPVATVDDLHRALTDWPDEEEATIELLRRGRRVKLRMRPIELPSPPRT